MKKFIIIIFAIICSCLSDKDEINISGEIKGLNNSFIYLIQPDSNTLLDSSSLTTSLNQYNCEASNEFRNDSKAFPSWNTLFFPNMSFARLRIMSLLFSFKIQSNDGK